MRFNKLYIILFLILGSCVTEFDFEAQPHTFTIVSGVITNSLGERTIKVTRTTGLDSVVLPVECTGAVYKNGAYEAELVPLKPGELVMPLSVGIEEGATYHIEITTPDKVYKSKPMLVSERWKTDSLSYILEERLDGFSSLGAPLKSWYVDVFAHFKLPDPGSKVRYYKWQVDEAWSIVSAANICYLSKSITENPVTIVPSYELQHGNTAVHIATAILDKSFLGKHYFNAYLHAIDKESFDFYEKAQTLINNDGKLFDEIPAPIEGNIYVDQGTHETVLGWVEFSLVDTLRLPITRSEISLRIFNQCDSPFPCAATGPCECTNCAAVHGFATLNKPFYWE